MTPQTLATGTPAPDSGLTGMPAWLAAIEGLFLPPQKNAPWTPTYAPPQTVSEPDNAGGQATQPLNRYYFPDVDTVAKLRARYDPDGRVIGVPLLGDGPDTATAAPPYLVWPNGVSIMAGLLAMIWSQNPANPDAADSLCRQMIAARGAK